MEQVMRRYVQIAIGLGAGLIAAAVCAGRVHAAPASGTQPLVEKIVLDDTIQPISAGELDRALARANADGAQALLIEMNTPGGLLESMRSMVGAILASRVPVIVYLSLIHI